MQGVTAAGTAAPVEAGMSLCIAQAGFCHILALPHPVGVGLSLFRLVPDTWGQNAAGNRSRHMLM